MFQDTKQIFGFFSAKVKNSVLKINKELNSNIESFYRPKLQRKQNVQLFKKFETS